MQIQRVTLECIAAIVASVALSVAPQASLAGGGVDSNARGWSSYQDEAVRLLQKYVQTDTQNPPGNELRGADFFKRLFDQAGIPNQIFAYGNGRANIYAVLKGDGSQRPLILLNHMDTVRAKPSFWRIPPLSGKIVNGEMWGRGSLDMKSLAIAQAVTMIRLAREHVRLRRDVIFLGTADEEVNDTGSDWMISHRPDLLNNAQFLITEGGPALNMGQGKVLYEVGTGEKAPLWLRLTATGPGGHASVPLSDSAPNRLARAMARVAGWQPPPRLLPFVADYFRRVAQLESAPLAKKFRDMRRALKDPTFEKAIESNEQYGWMLRDTVSLTVIRSGVQTNVIPSTAYCELDVRLLPGSSPEAFVKELRKVVDDPSIRIETILKFRPPNSSETNTLLYRAIEATIHELAPHALVTPFLDHGFTESEMYRSLGIQCYGWEPFVVPLNVEDTKHAPNERIPVDSFRQGVRMLGEVITRVCAR